MVPPPSNNVRQLFKQQQTQRQQQNKIEHAFAKYDSQGKLGCVLCKVVVKSEQLWAPHLQSAKHKQLLTQLKAIRQQQQQKETARKRPAAEQDIGSSSNGDAALLSKRARFEQLEKEMEQEEQEQQSESDGDDSDDSDQDMDEDNDENGLPADFFDTPTPKSTTAPAASTATTTSMKLGVHRDLPSGFFDDANEEAKARKVDAPDVMEDQQLDEEYAAFKEMMVDTNEETDKMLENDEETILLDREVTLAHQQLALDQKVQYLKQLRQQPHLLQQQQGNSTPTTLDERDGDSTWTTGLKSSVRTVMKQDSRKQAQAVFDDMYSDDEDEDEDNWRAQHL